MSTTSPQVEDLPRLDPLLTDPTRLLIAAALVWPASRRVEAVADAVGMGEDAVLPHLRRLGEAGYVETRPDEPQSGWVWMTEEGQNRLVAHLRALRVLLAKVDTLIVRK